MENNSPMPDTEAFSPETTVVDIDRTTPGKPIFTLRDGRRIQRIGYNSYREVPADE